MQFNEWISNNELPAAELGSYLIFDIAITFEDCGKPLIIRDFVLHDFDEYVTEQEIYLEHIKELKRKI